MKRDVVYKSTDGHMFDLMEECREHEKVLYINRLSGLGEEDIFDAIAGKNKELAITIKKVANMIQIRLRPKEAKDAKAATSK